MLKSAWFIARKDLAYMLRERETIVWLFFMPLVFFYFIGTVTGGFGAPTVERLALNAPADSGFLLDELVRRLEEQKYQVVRPAGDLEFARYARRLTVPDAKAEGGSFTKTVLAGTPVELTFDRSGAALAADYDRVRVSRAVYGLLADLALIANEEKTASPDAFARAAALPRSLTLKVAPAGRRHDPPSGFSQAIPGTLVMFTMLVLLTSGTALLVVEREQGLLRRLASAPLSTGSVVLGKWMGRMALALVQIAVGLMLGTVVFRVDWGSAFPMVCVVLFVWASFNASLAIVLGSLARSLPQAIAVGVLSTMVMAALGGCWWPIEITPAWMQRLALALPTGWTMDAMHKLVNFGYDARSAAPHVAVLLSASAILGLTGARVFRFR